MGATINNELTTNVRLITTLVRKAVQVTKGALSILLAPNLRLI